MKLENEFTVPAPIEQAWDVLLDMERVAPCLPGAALESSGGDEHVGTMTIKVGPITARYRGTVRVEEADEAARRTVMRAEAKDQRGQGTAAATITSSMETVPDGTRVRVQTEMRVTGPVAQFGRGVMQDVSAKLMRRFAECLAEEIAAAPAVGADAAPAPEEPVASGAAGVLLPPGPAAEAAEAAAHSTAAAHGAQSRAPESPPAADDVAGPRRRPAEDVLDLGAVGREAVLRRAAPAVAALAAAAAVAVVWRRRR
jgi:uncharacterized protein